MSDDDAEVMRDGPPRAGLFVAPRHLVSRADDVDNAVAILPTVACCWLWSALPSLSRGPTDGEIILPPLLMILGVAGAGLFFSAFELSGGTIGQRVAGVRHVRPDGSRLRPVDWLARHWPSFVAIGLVLILGLVYAAHPPFPTRHGVVRWYVTRTTALAVPAVLLMIWG